MEASGLLRPVWAEVDLDCVAHNMREVKRVVEDGVAVMAVIKADGYGHGAVHIGQTLLDNGADQFAVATLSEALALRHAYRDIPILVLGYTPEAYLEQALACDIMVTLFTEAQAVFLSALAGKLGKTAQVHLKVDTGMRRLGFPATAETVERISNISTLPYIKIEGVFTHFAKADEADKSFAHEQVRRFRSVTDSLKARGVDCGRLHVSNSAGIIDLPEYQFDMVRAGIMLYGLYPSKEVCRSTVRLKEAMTLKARIAQVKTVERGDGVSYGHRFVADRTLKIATLPIGYADGFSRLLAGRVQVSVSGVKRPVVGTICMDQCMVDVTDLEVKRDDEVVLFGATEGSNISIDVYASYLGTINYEVVCMVGKRVPRVYFQNARILHVEDFNLMHDFF